MAMLDLQHFLKVVRIPNPHVMKDYLYDRTLVRVGNSPDIIQFAIERDIIKSDIEIAKSVAFPLLEWSRRNGYLGE